MTDRTITRLRNTDCNRQNLSRNHKYRNITDRVVTESGIQNEHNVRRRSYLPMETIQNVQNARGKSDVLLQIVQDIQIVRGRSYVLRQII